MERSRAAFLAAAVLCFVCAAPAFARGDRGAPGPLAGVGLPFLLAAGAAGAYRLVRRRREEAGTDECRNASQD